MNTHDLMSLLHETRCYDDPTTDSYHLWKYLQCTYQYNTENEPQPESLCAFPDKTNYTYDAVMKHRAFVLHWVGYLKNKINNHVLANRYPLQATYALQQEDVVGFMNMIQALRQMANHLSENTHCLSFPVSVPSSPNPDANSKKRPEIRRSARLAKKKQQTRILNTNDVVRGC